MCSEKDPRCLDFYIAPLTLAPALGPLDYKFREMVRTGYKVSTLELYMESNGTLIVCHNCAAKGSPP